MTSIALSPHHMFDPHLAHDKETTFVPKDEEAALRTNGVVGRYHVLLNEPFQQPLATAGYIIGIEKAPRGAIGFPGKAEDGARLQKPHSDGGGFSDQDVKEQQGTFRVTFDDPKVMFVSHILRWGKTDTATGFDADLLHSCYSRTAFGAYNAVPLTDAYEAGWRAMDALQPRILADIQSARDSGRPFTHLLFASMGWNNDQTEALKRYNGIIKHSQRAAHAAGEVFNPLLIGLTWPSVWGGTSQLAAVNIAAHLGSYPNKARDADEIGFGIANHVLNTLLPRVEAATGLTSVAIGHSMGARILSRAYHSAHLLQNAVTRTGTGPILIGLQGAFSVSRYLANYRLWPVIRSVLPSEGGPYQNHAAPGGQSIMTWSDHDDANKSAIVATGAAHIGGATGSKRVSRTDEIAAKFERFEVPSSGDLEPLDAACDRIKANSKVLYIDGTSIIKGHNDIRNPKVGELIWRVVRQLGK